MAPWLAGCRWEGSGPTLEGSIVGASHALGHRLRQKSSEGPSGPRQRVQVVIAGGGVAALTAAWRLSHGGLEDYLVLELEQQLGGNSRGADYPQSPAPWAAHYLPVPTRESRVVRRLLTEMGLMKGLSAAGAPLYDEVQLCHANEERLFFQGGWEEGLFPKAALSKSELRQFQEFEQHVQAWEKWRDRQGRKAFAIPMAYSSQDPELLALDRLSMGDYLRQKGWDSPRLHWYVDYGCRDDYGTSLEKTSAWAGLHYFASRDGGGYEPKDLQFVWPEGNHRLVRHLQGGLRSRARSAQLVTRVQRQQGEWWVDCWSQAEQNWVGYAAPQVILAVPTFLRPYLLGEPARPTFSYSPWTICNLIVDPMPETAHNLSWDNVLYGSPSLGYVVANHQTNSSGLGPGVWTHYRPWTEMEPAEARQQLLKTSWSQVCENVFSDLVGPHPDLRSCCRRLDVMQLGHAMVRPLPGFLVAGERLDAARPRDGLHFAHSDLSGFSIFEEASYHGVRAAQEVLGTLGLLREDFLLD